MLKHQDTLTKFQSSWEQTNCIKFEPTYKVQKVCVTNNSLTPWLVGKVSEVIIINTYNLYIIITMVIYIYIYIEGRFIPSLP